MGFEEFEDTPNGRVMITPMREEPRPTFGEAEELLEETDEVTFTRSPRRPLNTNRCPAKRSCFTTASACAASPVNPLRMSVALAASQTRVLAGTGITASGPGSGAPMPRDHSHH